MSKKKTPKIEMKNLECVLCGFKFKITEEDFLHSKNYGNYIVTHPQGTSMAYMASGTLCDVCLNKPLEQRKIIGE